MKIKTGVIYFLCLVGIILFGMSGAQSAEIDPYPTVIIPIFDGGYNFQKYLDASKETKSIRYYVQTGYPPAEVLEFYDAYFNGKGWRSSFEICQRNWEDLGQGKKTAGLPLRQLFASWDHPELNVTAVLWLTSEMSNNGRQSKVDVQFRLQPKVEK